MATFKVMLDQRRQLNNGTFPLVLRVYSGTKFRDMSLKIHLKPNEFNPNTQKATNKHPNYKLFNQKISQAVLQAQETALKLELCEETVSADKVKRLVVKPQPKLDFIAYGWIKTNELKEVNQYGNSCIYRDALNSLIRYSGKTEIGFKEIDYPFLKQLESKMLQNEVKINSISICLRTIRAIYNKAIKEKLVDKSYYPFDEFRIKNEATAKRAIDKAAIVKMSALKLEVGSPQWKARSFFLLSFNLIGMSFADMVSIEPKDIVDGRLVYKRKKTHKLYNIKLTDQAKDILEHYLNPQSRYILPVLSNITASNPKAERETIQQAIKVCNKHLKRISELLELNQCITTYVARHSWATIAKKMGYSKDLISEALGHSFGNRTTEIYLDSFDQEIIDDMNEKVCRL